jgi:TetR/AcrR family transcriptional repressor of bet genes
MPKVGMQPVRKRQLIDATIATIAEHGFGEATIARIARRAGLSSGIIAHYFGGKDALLAATMRHLLTELLRDATDRLKRARTPLERAEAVIAANFGPSQFNRDVIAAWFAFWGEVPHAPELKRLNDVYMRRTRANLKHALRPVAAEPHADRIARVAACLIDGIWVRAALTETAPDAEGASRMIMATIRAELAETARSDVMNRADVPHLATDAAVPTTTTTATPPPLPRAVPD